MRSISSGWRSACLPRTKNVALAPSVASASSTFGVVSGDGPSSKVMATTGSVTVAPLMTRPKSGELAANAPQVTSTRATAKATSSSQASQPSPTATSVRSATATTSAARIASPT
jgi:hypothetical protein